MQPLIFDLDGTLWDTSGPVADAWNVALQRAGLSDRQVSPDDIASIMGLTHEQIFPRLFPDLDPEKREALSLLCYEEEESHLRRLGGTLYPGVEEGLRSLARQRPLAIVSNCQRGYIELFLDWTGLGGLFADWECHGNTGRPKGDNVRLVMQRQGWTRATVVGDTAGDQQAATQAGCDFVFAAYGFGRVEGEPRRLQSFADLHELVAR